MTQPTLSLPALPRAEVERSWLGGRAVFVVDRSRTGSNELLAGALERTREVCRVTSSGIFAEGLPRMFGNHHLSQDGGLGTLVTARELMAATRRLADDLIGGPQLDERLVVDHTALPGTDIEILRALYPDATVVVIAGSSDDARAADVALAPAAVATSPSSAAEAVLAAARRSRPAPRARSSTTTSRDELRDRLILVFGVPRSGTTWLEQLLLAPSRTAGVDASETWIFQALQGFWHNHEAGLGLDGCVERAALSGALRAFCDQLFLVRLRQVDGATHFVEKTPGNAWLLPWINAVYPDAWYVHLVRDGRDVSRSAAEMDHGTAGDVRSAASAWAATLREVSSRRHALARFRELRYEDLLKRPVEQATSLLGWAGVDISPGDAEAIRSQAGVRVSRHGTTGPVGPGKWKGMAPAERQAVLAAAGDVLTQYGYASPSDVQAARRAQLLPRAVAAAARRRFTSARRARG